MQIIRLPNRTATSLGTTYLVDDPLIEKPEPTSELVGRAQGIYAFASQRDYGCFGNADYRRMNMRNLGMELLDSTFHQKAEIAQK
ncbi:hypothetical protein Goklo_029613 [Gossypium klotzschianum]|uniref:Dirigent protein n=1 Tax=Gossypium klotzschianum TaxID=34286 RepID=A0A7J8WF37_9ROSI|nr:hypothetical protein [Gossypium klotzschianum]